MQYVGLGLRLLVALVCLAAVLGKARNRRAFGEFIVAIEQVARSVPLVRAPARFARRWGPPIVLAELVVALLLPWQATAPAGGAIAVGLFATLTAGVAVAASQRNPARCACFGRMTRTVGREHVVRNLVLTGVALAGWLVTLVTLSSAAGPVSAAGVAVCLTAAAAGTALFVYWDDLAALLLDRVELTELTAQPAARVRP